ncbi:MAG: flagellar basal body P-ring protein FlgI [Candidatus Sulfotelmatobacter sp.]|jgi:DNA uptake protein ComE-like DNA-binding protein
MKRLGVLLMSAVFALAPMRCRAEQACAAVTVEASVEAVREDLTLADLIGGDSCPQLQEAAAQVKLGAAPRPGSVRVLDGGRIRRLLEGLAEQDSMLPGIIGGQIPQRIVVQRTGATIACAEIARFVQSAAGARNGAAAAQWESDLDCAGARGVPEGAPLKLTSITWNAALRRREFALRCVRPQACVPFLVWAREEKTATRVRGQGDIAHDQVGHNEAARNFPAVEKALVQAGTEVSGAELLVKPGQTATLTWDEAGVRVVLPVTCLDAGGRGEFVRVRPLAVGGYAVGSSSNSKSVNHPTVGRIPNGGLVERDTSLDLSKLPHLSLLLNETSFSTVEEVAAVINHELGTLAATVIDSRRVEIKTPVPGNESLPALLARIENLQIQVHRKAKVVVNERTGTVVLGKDVRLGAVSILHGNFSIAVTTTYAASQPNPLAGGQTVVLPETSVKATDAPARNVELNEGASVEELVTRLQAIGATARDVVSILQAIKAAGALEAELEVI